MDKKNLGVLFGGQSTEHDVSIVSGLSILKNLDKERFNIYPIYIDKDGNFFEYTDTLSHLDSLTVGDNLINSEKLKEIDNIIGYLKKFDLIFPVLHGLYGEDGSIQGLFELLKVPYVGCGILSSSVGMDKAYTKIIFDRAQINQAEYVYIRKYKHSYIYIDEHFNETILDLPKIVDNICNKLQFPMFVKPSNSGSSVGITKAHNIKELSSAIEYAGKFDTKILIENGINGREIECAVLGNEEVIASCVGEILSAEEFYSFDSKYKNSESKVVIPANLNSDISDEIRTLAIKAFKSVDGKGLARVDFFVENGTNKVFINEINTMPGFTEISMYPKLFDNVGLHYKDLLNKIIDLALEK